MANLHLGTCGWNYPDWRDGFYAGLPSCDWLARYASRFQAVEVDSTFYRQQRPATFARWREQTPDGFAFSIKGHRYLTHVLRLAATPEALEKSRVAAAQLEDKLAAVLWQTPRSLHKDLARLERFAALLRAWPEARHVMEFRHASWFDGETAACLRAHGIANCLSDAADWPLWDEVTSGLAYLRLHGHAATYSSRYSEAELAAWADRIRGWMARDCTVHVYFDNTAGGAALENAMRLREMLG